MKVRCLFFANCSGYTFKEIGLFQNSERLKTPVGTENSFIFGIRFNIRKKQAKSDFIANKTEEFKQQPKQLWQLLKSLGTSTHCNSKPGSIGLNIDNSICFDNSLVSEHFNNYFTNVASTLFDQLPPNNDKYESEHFQDFYRSLGVTSNSFCFSEVSENNVLSILC